MSLWKVHFDFDLYPDCSIMTIASSVCSIFCQDCHILFFPVLQKVQTKGSAYHTTHKVWNLNCWRSWDATSQSCAYSWSERDRGVHFSSSHTHIVWWRLRSLSSPQWHLLQVSLHYLSPARRQQHNKHLLTAQLKITPRRHYSIQQSHFMRQCPQTIYLHHHLNPDTHLRMSWYVHVNQSRLH